MCFAYFKFSDRPVLFVHPFHLGFQAKNQYDTRHRPWQPCHHHGYFISCLYFRVRCSIGSYVRLNSAKRYVRTNMRCPFLARVACCSVHPHYFLITSPINHLAVMSHNRVSSPEHPFISFLFRTSFPAA